MRIRLMSVAAWMANICAVVMSVGVVWAGYAWLDFKSHEINCLTTVVHHEARGEAVEVRNLVALVVLAAVGDASFTKARTVCKFARINHMFSNLHTDRITEVRADVRGWSKIRDEVSEVYGGLRALPNGWGCVRAFRDSDDYLESVSSKAMKQLGITKSAKGLKYHAAAFVPVGTRGKITFYSPRGGCKNPTPTA